MKMGLVNFSGRYSQGNCSKIVDYISWKCAEEEIVASHLKITTLNLLPCCKCNYECFSSSCPHEDDLEDVYHFIVQNDTVIFVLPVYSSAPPATYFAWRERSQCFFSNAEFYDAYSRVKKVFILIGNADAGGENAVRIIKEGDDSPETACLLLENHKYGLSSLAGKLIEVNDYDIAEKKLVREVRTKEVECSTYGVCKNTDGDLYIISNSVLYEYKFTEDVFILLHTFEEDEAWEPFLYSKMAYCKERNSIFYTVNVDEVFQINELKLDTYHIDYRFPGLIPRYVDKEKRLYSLSPDQKAIQFISLDNVDSFEVNILWANKAEIFDLSVIDQNMIWLIHHPEKADFWGNKLLLSDLLINQELFKPVSKVDIDYFSIVDFRFSTPAERF